MSSGKPQTRGLAALLRIEKERRAREEEESLPPEGVDEQPVQVEAVPPPNAPEQAAEIGAAPHDSGAAAAAGVTEVSEDPSEEGRTPASFETDVVATEPLPHASPPAAAAAGGDQGQLNPASPFPALAPSTPRPRRSSTRPSGASRKSAVTPIESPQATNPGWEKFVADWKPFLRQGVKFKLCEFFYQNTVAAGRHQFITSTAQLSRVSGAHRRHIFLVLRQLEELRFIKKESVETNRKDEGLVISFFPDRQA